MADYFGHWLKVGRRDGAKLPGIFYVNWFRKDANGRFLWPGFGDNARVLAWIFRRLDGAAEATETPIGNVPRAQDLETEGLGLTPQDLTELLTVDEDLLRDEVDQVRGYLDKFGDRLPPEVRSQFEALQRRLT
jgi:phosphoenolpyruvate carboxykinase (GTP)